MIHGSRPVNIYSCWYGVCSICIRCVCLETSIKSRFRSWRLHSFHSLSRRICPSPGQSGMPSNMLKWEDMLHTTWRFASRQSCTMSSQMRRDAILCPSRLVQCGSKKEHNNDLGAEKLIHERKYPPYPAQLPEAPCHLAHLAHLTLPFVALALRVLAPVTPSGHSNLEISQPP